jgi:uncharacterized protein (TIGR02597 family)
MKPKAFLLAALLAAVSTQGITMAAEVSTDPVGVNKVTALGNSDTRFSVPLHRPAEFQGVVHSVNGGDITVQGLPTWNVNAFVYTAGTQSNTYYVSFISGNKEGMYYTVTANTVAAGANTATVTVDLNGDTFAGATGVAQGDKFKIIPYWTLKTLFPGQVGITGTTAAGGAGSATKIYFPNLTSAGINFFTGGVCFYYTGTGGSGPGWRKVGSGVARMDDEVVVPDSFLIIRQEGVATSAIHTPTGVVPMSKRKIVLGTLQANLAQDNPVAIDVLVPMTLSESQLYQSGAFEGTTSAGGAVGGDRLFVYDDAAVGYNKSPIAMYFYYTGTAGGGPSWRMIGGGTANKNSEPVFAPGRGYIIRKASQAVPASVIWPVTPPYVVEAP